MRHRYRIQRQAPPMPPRNALRSSCCEKSTRHRFTFNTAQLRRGDNTLRERRPFRRRQTTKRSGAFLPSCRPFHSASPTNLTGLRVRRKTFGSFFPPGPVSLRKCTIDFTKRCLRSPEGDNCPSGSGTVSDPSERSSRRCKTPMDKNKDEAKRGRPRTLRGRHPSTRRVRLPENPPSTDQRSAYPRDLAPPPPAPAARRPCSDSDAVQAIDRP